MGKNENSGLKPEVLMVFETLPGMFLVLSTDLVILTASNDYLKASRKSRLEITGRLLFDVFAQNLSVMVEKSLKESLKIVLTTKLPHQLPIIPFTEEGVTRYWQTAHTPVLNAAEEIDYIIHHTIDVTHQVLAEEELKHTIELQKNSVLKSEQLRKRLAKILQEVPGQIAVFSGPDMVYDFVNPFYQNNLFPGKTLLGKPLLSIVPELAGHPIVQMMDSVYKTGETIEGKEMLIPLMSGREGVLQEHYFNFVHQASMDENGMVNGVITFAYDITEQVKSRKALEIKEQQLISLNEILAKANQDIIAYNKELRSANEELFYAQNRLEKLNDDLEERVVIRTSEALAAKTESEHQRLRLKNFFMQAPAGICILSGKDLVFELINPSYQQLFPGRDLIGKPLLEAIPEIEGQPIWDILQDVYTTGKTFEGKELNIPLARYENAEVEDRFFNFIYQASVDINNNIDGIIVFVFEVTEMTVTRKLIEKNEERFQFLLNAMPQQVWTASADGELNYVNQVICDNFNISHQEVIEKGLNTFVHQDDLANTLADWEKALTTGGSYEGEFRIRMHDGEYRWHLGRALPLIEEGQIKLWVGTNTNIDVQKTNEQKKDDFLSIASHELKTPLTSISAFNQLMKRTKDPDMMAVFADKAAGSIDRLRKLINDLLDVTKINAGKMIYEMQEFNLREMLVETVDQVQHFTNSHQIILNEMENLFYTGDRFRIEQVVNNFLTNAIKYSPQGKHVIVTCKVQLNNIIVSVQDFGIGIANEDLSKLFERYYRADNTSMRFEGLGLGLFISSEILKRHQGSFWIESEVDKGSTFFFRLPIESSKRASGKVDITYNALMQRLDVDWIGFQDMESVKKGCMMILDMVGENNCTKILNDNTNVLGTWSEASEWVGEEFFPMLEAAGLKYFAWIYSPSVFSSLSAEKSVDVALCNIVTQFFTDIPAAEEWINQK